ncbi:MAG: Maf family protein [Clostridiales bacterium]|nr:Maf family protein [Clostridiales bacterium]
MMNVPDRTGQEEAMRPGKDEKIILASASPRRKAMLELFGVPFEVIPSELSEFFAEGEGQWRALDLARKKAFMLSRKHPGRYILAADTMVQVGKTYLGKPKDRADAVRMLKMLSGRAHHVYTGVCLRRPDGSELYDASITRVAFITLPEELIERYVDTGEPMDKAGGYALQGIAGAFISRIEGSPTGVVGLPLAMVTQLLWRAGFDIPLRSEGEIKDWYDPKYDADAAGRDGD